MSPKESIKVLHKL